MSTLTTTLSITEQMTAPIMSINNAILNLTNQFNAAQSAADIDASSLAAMHNQVQMAGFAAEQMNQMMSLIGQTTDQVTAAQEGHNDSLDKGCKLADILSGKIGKLAGIFGIGFGIKSTIDFFKDCLAQTDQQIRAEQQLANVLANQGRSQEDFLAVKEKAAEIQSRGMYDEGSMIAGAGELATYISDPAALASAMDTLTNYAAGMSRGMEVDDSAMVEYATQLGKALDGSTQGIKLKGFDLTDVQKQIMKTGTDMEKALILDEVISQSWNNAYEDMSNAPTGQIASIKNAFGDIQEEIGARLYPVIMEVIGAIKNNMPAIQQMLLGVVPAIQFIIQRIRDVINVAFAVYKVFAANWSWIGPIIGGIAAVLAIYYGRLLLVNGIEMISKGIRLASAFATMVQGAAMSMAAGASFGLTAATWGLNAALLACPLTWIILAIIAVIVAIVAWANSVGGFRILWMIVVNAILTAWDWVKIGFFTGIYWVLDLWNKLKLGMMTAGVAIANFMGDMKANVLMILQKMVNGAIDIINGFIGTLNKIPGVNIGLIEQVSFGTRAQLDNEAEKQKREAGLQAYRDEIEAGIAGRASELDAMKADARTATANRLSEIDAARNAAAAADAEKTTTSDFVSENFDGVADNVANISANTAAQLDSFEENIKLWRDIAERDAINNITTPEVDVSNLTSAMVNPPESLNYSQDEMQLWRNAAESDVVDNSATTEIHVEFGDINNAVSSEMDLDNIIDYFSEKVEEALLGVAEGVYA